MRICVISQKLVVLRILIQLIFYVDVLCLVLQAVHSHFPYVHQLPLNNQIELDCTPHMEGLTIFGVAADQGIFSIDFMANAAQLLKVPSLSNFGGVWFIVKNNVECSFRISGNIFPPIIGKPDWTNVVDTSGMYPALLFLNFVRLSVVLLKSHIRDNSLQIVAKLTLEFIIVGACKILVILPISFENDLFTPLAKPRLLWIVIESDAQFILERDFLLFQSFAAVAAFVRNWIASITINKHISFLIGRITVWIKANIAPH
jgi:hypothetical protein